MSDEVFEQSVLGDAIWIAWCRAYARRVTSFEETDLCEGDAERYFARFTACHVAERALDDMLTARKACLEFVRDRAAVELRLEKPDEWPGLEDAFNKARQTGPQTGPLDERT